MNFHRAPVDSRRVQNPFTLSACTLLALLATVGCSTKNVAQVSGRVQYKDGSPIEGAVRLIRFEPTEDSTAEIRKTASGQIASDGSFQLFTRKPGDGVYLGSYAVTFTVLTKPMGGESLIPEKFNYASSTPYVVDINGDAEDLTFELEKR